MTTLAEVQLLPQLKAATTQDAKDQIAAKIIWLRAVEYLDGLRMVPMEERDIKKVINFIGFPSPLALGEFYKELEKSQ